jgi:hypothetical protein
VFASFGLTYDEQAPHTCCGCAIVCSRWELRGFSLSSFEHRRGRHQHSAVGVLVEERLIAAYQGVLPEGWWPSTTDIRHILIRSLFQIAFQQCRRENSEADRGHENSLLEEHSGGEREEIKSSLATIFGELRFRSFRMQSIVRVRRFTFLEL